jgi:hypothetical protein
MKDLHFLLFRMQAIRRFKSIKKIFFLNRNMVNHLGLSHFKKKHYFNPFILLLASPSTFSIPLLHASSAGACSFLLVQKRTKKGHPKTKLPVFGVEYVLSCCTTVVHCSRALFGKQLIKSGH